MREQQNLLAVVRALSEMSGEEVARLDPEGSMIMVRALSQLHEDIAAAIVTLECCCNQIKCQPTATRH